MKKFRKFINFKSISIVVLVVLMLLIELVLWFKESKLQDQFVADKWEVDTPVAQISCFFSNQSYISEDSIISFEHQLDDLLKTDSIALPPEKEGTGAKLWVDTYSGESKVDVVFDGNPVNLNALGVGGDYFYFHPGKLLGGCYFQGSDYNHDYCVLDKEAAWKLFGSTECVGLVVEIYGQPFMVSGVIENPKGKIYEDAGLDKGKIILSYDSLTKLTGNVLINHFEVVMPNPVKQYAYNLIEKNIGIDENEFEIVENSTRFDKLKLLQHLKVIPNRAMNKKAVIYPYWENVARVREDQMSELTLLQLILLICALIIFIIIVVIWWGNRTYTFGSLVQLLRDKYYDFSAYIYNKMRKKGGKYEK